VSVIIRVLLRRENCCNDEVFHRSNPSPRPRHTDCSLFTSTHCSPILSPPFSPTPCTFLHNQGFLYFYTNPPFAFAIFFPSMGVDPYFILSLPLHSSLILFDYLPLIPRRDGKLLCCWFSKTKLWKVRTIQSQCVHKLATLVGKTGISKETARVFAQIRYIQGRLGRKWC
jgi:hypothetical protein